MGRRGAQHRGYSLRLRAITSLLLALLFGMQAAPLLRAQAPTALDCCMAAEGKGCSMHLHRAARGEQGAHLLGALQARCPCTPVAPSNAGSHDALALSGSQTIFTFAQERSACNQPRSVGSVQTAGSGGTRGPPSGKLFA